ncbi:hypothetical protein SLS56_011127 [Neofusicoccum ribis]|uniref:Tat pathway signal sequence n=1 Tax=Neofusicoccum ribis TaxID=45134 RepID=A0ABR3SCL9_9PEZI
MFAGLQRYNKLPHNEAESEGGGPVRWHTNRPARWPYAAIAFLTLGWAFTAAYAYRSRTLETGLLHAYRNTPIPKEVFQPVKKVFMPDQRYIGQGPEVEAAWDSLVAGTCCSSFAFCARDANSNKAHDAVWIENPQQYGFDQGILAPFDHPNTPNPKPQDFYVISILHQLHCLNMVRFQYYKEVNTNDTSRQNDAHMWKLHVEHCWEYLRQAISCGGDLIIEGNSPIKVGKGHATSVTGWGVEHDCINIEALWDFQIGQEEKYNLTWQTIGS